MVTKLKGTRAYIRAFFNYIRMAQTGVEPLDLASEIIKPDVLIIYT